MTLENNDIEDAACNLDTKHLMEVLIRLNSDLPNWLGFLGLRTVLGEVAHFLTIVTGRPGGWIPFGLQQFLELLSEGTVPGAGDGAVAVALIPVGSLAWSESIEPLLLFGIHGGVGDFNNFSSG